MARKLTPYEYTHLQRFKPQLLRAVQNGEFDQSPVEYVSGKVEFGKLLLSVNKHTLIPRVETEELVERASFSLRQLAKSQKPLCVVDVGTGSGAIGLSLWRQAALLGISAAKFYLVDISPDALKTAKQNYLQLRQQLLTELPSVQKSELPSLNFLQSNLLTKWPAGKTISLLVANLPYIPTGKIATLPAAVKKYEPLTALDGGFDGLTLIRMLLDQASLFLEKRGVCWLEMDETHSAFKIHARSHPGLHGWDCVDFTDSFAKTRFARCQLTRQKKPSKTYAS